MNDVRIEPGPGVPGGLTIPESELAERFAKSSGPGGQGVNTTDTKVQLSIDLAATESSLLARDRFDSTRTVSPLTRAADAIHLDTTPYTLDEVADLIVGLVEGDR